MNIKSIVILLVGIIALPCCVYAQMATDSVVHREVSEVSVFASRQKEIIPVQKLSGEGLRNLNAYSVADAVRYFSGVQIKDYGGVGGLKTVDIRSMGSNHLGVFYDGLQIGNAQNGTVDLGKFSLDNVEEVAVYNGQKSDVFQSAKDFGTSGSLYIRTRRPVFSNGRLTNFKMSLSGGSFGLKNVSMLLERFLTKNLSASVNAEFTHATGKYNFRYHKVLEDIDGRRITAWDTTGTRQNGDIRSLRLEGSVFGSVEDGAWHAKIYYYNSERGIPRAIVRNVWTSSQRQWDRSFFVQSMYQRRLTDLYSTKASAKYSYDFMRYFNPDTTLLYVDNRFRQYAVYGSSANMFAWNEWFSSDVCVDYERNWMKSDMAMFPSPKRDVLLAAVALSLTTSKINLQVSLLYNFFHDATTILMPIEKEVSRNTKKLTPAIIADYKPVDVVDIRAFYKKMFRMPTFNDLYYTDLGNISLRPEYAEQFDIGVTTGIQSAIDWNIAVDVYHNKITDKIVAVPKGNSQFRWMMMNIGKVSINGIDMKSSLSTNQNQNVQGRLTLSYTYQKALDMTDKNDDGPRGTYKGQISYIPRHSGSVVANVSYDGYSFNYSFIYVGERYHVSANIPENYEPSWYTHDLNVQKRLCVNNKMEFVASAEVINILDQQYDVVLNYPMPGRNYKIKLTLSI
ncbi:MAG: TonB-dependent receptor [Bacteroidales bacterium]|nr:TonB-dependent receptor [Bacteroidales bacterium]